MSEEQPIKLEYAENLTGLNGFVYLMFVGGERYAEEFRGKFVEYGLVKNKENVNQAIDKLRKKGFLRFVKTEKKARGPPAKLYTASLEPLMETLESIAPVDYHWVASKMKFKTIHHLVFEYFPRFVSIEKKYLQYSVKNRSWDTITKTFLGFLVMIAMDFVIEKLDIPDVMKRQVAFMVPMILLSTEEMDDKKPLSSELSTLKKEIMENLSPEDKTFFRGLLPDFEKIGLVKSKGVKP